MKRRFAVFGCITVLVLGMLTLGACARHGIARPERLTAEPVSREMVELVRLLHAKS